MIPDIVYNEFHIDFSLPFEDQPDCLTEDLLQLNLGNNRLLDIGWYPEFDPGGCFLIQVIHDNDWLEPEFSVFTRSEADLRNAVTECIRRAGGTAPADQPG